MKKIAIIDIDGCLCPSIFANIKHNDNGKFTPEFVRKLETVKPYQWAREWDWKQYEKKRIITGRITEWKVLSERWLGKLFNEPVWGPGAKCNYLVTCVEWDDSLESREASGKDYIRRKVLKCAENIAFHLYLGYEVDVFEDDLCIITDLKQMWDSLLFRDNITIYQVENGKIWV